MEKFIIEDEVVPVISHDLAKCPSPRRIQKAALTVSNAPSFASILEDREYRGPKQPDLISSPNTAVEGIHHGGYNSKTSFNFWKRSPPVANITPKVHKVVNKGDRFSLHNNWWW